MVLDENWEERAACSDKPTQWFMLPDRETRRKGESRNEFNARVRENLRKGKEVCDYSCPVWLECLLNASDTDTKVTIRGGALPSGLVSLTRGMEEEDSPQGSLRTYEVSVQDRLDELPLVRGSTCPKGHPVSLKARRKAGVDKNRLYGLTEDGKCRKCRKYLLNSVSNAERQRRKRQKAKESATL